MRLFRVVNTGKPKEWGVPAYNGGMFSEEAVVSPAGGLLAGISLPNKDFGPVLCDLLVDPTPEGFGPVDFRSLGVREFGTIYEGSVGERAFGRRGKPDCGQGKLLCSGGQEGTQRPPGANLPAQRQRRAQGHGQLLHQELRRRASSRPRLGAGDCRPSGPARQARRRRAAESFFDFRVADIAMGSGHFLVAAVDRIERRFSSYLAKRPLPGVMGELLRLRKAALDGIEQAGGSIDGMEIENVQLLRRQIARRCIYGVDINNIAVQLARLSLWIHTFVPGLPLSFLDHNIVCGNSLVGIATFEEVDELLSAAARRRFSATRPTR